VSVPAGRRRNPIFSTFYGSRRAALLSGPVSGRTDLLCLFGLAVLSSLLRMALVSRVHAPTVFSDELGYARLAQSLGETGHLGLFSNPGASYSPLYPALLSPIYALGASAPTAYSLIKIVNAVLISLSVFPTYKIARFVLPRRFSLLVAAVSVFAPLMSYSSFSMSENLAYPLCLVAIWSMLEAVCRPSALHDAALLVSIGLASAARVQLVVLLPVALTAMVFAAVLAQNVDHRARSLLRTARDHLLLILLPAVGLVAAGAASFAGHDVLAISGRYAVVGRRGLPNVWHFLDLLARHVAGVDLAVGVVPFVAAIVTAVAFRRSGRRPEHRAFAAVAVAATAWLLVEVAFDASLFDSPSGDVPRIHERFLIYVVPFFLVALVAAYRLPESRDRTRLYLAAAATAVLLPVVIPFHTVVNNTISVDSFGLEPLGRVERGSMVAVPHATLAAIWLAATFALLYVRVRERLRTVVLLVLLFFVGVTVLARMRIESGSLYGRSLLPAHVNWVDRAKPSGDVVLVTGAGPSTSALQTAYFNLSIDRLYYVCHQAFGPDFGEQQVTIDGAGRLRDSSGFVRARYAVMPASLVVRGRIVASNVEGDQVLVAAPKGPLGLPLAKPSVNCRRTAYG
jgi:hypothetical protein